MHKSSKKRNTIVSLLLVVALAITGAFAYLTATDTATNLFTVGNVKVELTEPNWDPDTDSDGDGVNDTLSNIVANQTIKKDPTVTNIGDNDAYAYIMVKIPKVYETDINNGSTTTTESHYPLFSFEANEGWTLIDSQVGTETDAYDYYLYAYDTALVPGGTATLFDEVTFANITENFVNTITGEAIVDLEIKVTGYAIQSDYYNDEASDAASAWTLYANQNNWAWPENKYEGLVSVNYLNENDELVNTDTVYSGTPIEMYFEPSLAKDGYTFDWVDETTGETAYSGMTVEDNTTLTATYTETGYSSEQTDYLEMLVDYNDEVGYHAVVVGADTSHPNYPTELTTITIPAYINVTGYGNPNIAPTSQDAQVSWSVNIGNSTYSTPNTTFSIPVTRINIIDNSLHDVMETLVLPDTVTFIQNVGYAVSSNFTSGNTVLKNVVMSYGVKDISNQTFLNFTALENITFTNSLKSLGKSAFRNCTSLKEIELKASVTEIGVECFQGCTSLEKVTIRSVETLGKYMFSGCTSLKTVLLGGVKTIGEGAFESCKALESISLPASLKTIEYYAFGMCTSLKEVTFNEGLETIGALVFVDSPIEDVYIPDSVTSIGSSAFCANGASPLYTASVPSTCQLESDSFPDWTYSVTYR